MEFDNIDFSIEDASNLSHPNYDALIISILMSNYLVKRALIDNGNSTNIIFASTLNNMQLSDSDMIQKVTTLISFNGEPK